MEDLTPQLQQKSIGPNTGDKWLWLCKFVVATHPTQRIARDTKDVTYNSEVFEKMSLQVGSQTKGGDGSIPEVVLKVSALNETLYHIIEATNGAVGSDVQLIKVNTDVLDASVPALEADYELLASQADDDWMTFTLGVPNPMKQRYSLRDYSSSICPWAHPDLFKGVRCGYAAGDPTCTGTLEDCISKSNEIRWGAFIGMDPVGMTI